MQKTEVEQLYNEITGLIVEKRIAEAIERLHELIKVSEKGLLIDHLELQRETYANILKHSFTSVEDPEKDKIYNRLVVSLFELADHAKEAIFTNVPLVAFYHTKRNLETEGNRQHITDRVDQLLSQEDLSKFFEGGAQEEQPEPEDAERKQTITDYFNLVWLTDQFNGDELELHQRFMASESVTWYEKCLIVSAVTLSLQRCFDTKKLNFLFDIYETFENQVWQRALIGIVLSLFQYDARIPFYEEIREKLDAYKGNEAFQKYIEMIVIQLIRSKETERINKKLQDEILPEVEKVRPKLNEKLGLDSILSETDMEDKNPDWETFFRDTPGLFEKLEEISRMQMEGSDVFMSAFSMLKHFPFFNETHNWFLPFYEENQSAREALANEQEYFDTAKFLKSLAQSSFMCNSDKYSFCLNVQMIPQEQKSQMAELFKMELQGMEELSKEDEVVNQEAKAKTVITQYLQDLYRFYVLNNNKHFFYNVFQTSLDLYNSYFFNELMQDTAIIRNIGEFYFEKEYYEDAVTLFNRLYEQGNVSGEILEKTAYAYQRQKKYKEAINAYQLLELTDRNAFWVQKNMGLCYRRLRQPEKAIEHYKAAEQQDPEDLYVQTYLGHCHLDIKDYENALHYYFKVEYLAPSNNRIMRPIAWCSFILGKYETAAKYYSKLIEKQEANAYDYLNNGHVEWCMANPLNAIESYSTSLQFKDYSFDQFANDFLADKEVLIDHGIKDLDVHLMLDHLKMNADKS